MKKNINLSIITFISTVHLLFAQGPPKELDARFGGSGPEFLNSLQQTSDGGYILGGYSGSGISGDKTQASQGNNDYWIVKVNNIGIKQWDARFGGSGSDMLTSMQQTSDGGYILGGKSDSPLSGDKTQVSQGLDDYWIVKVNSSGVKQWDARFGGTFQDDLNSIQQTSDGGYILGGTSGSALSGDKTQASRGGDDYWIVKVNSSGVKEWDASFGGSGFDVLRSVQQTIDGGYILGGQSNSPISGDKTQASQGGYDYWIVKVNSSGVKQWDACFGGSNDDNAYSVKQSSDGGFIIGGESQSGISGDKTQTSQGGADFWVVKVNNSGIKQWDARFGGTDMDLLIALQQTSDGGYIFGGESNSPISGDKTQASQGGIDYWVVKVNSSGVKQWDAQYGGSNIDDLTSLQQTSDGGYILGGESLSPISGDKTQASQGNYDYWIVKLSGIVTNSITGSPFCSGSNVNVSYTVNGTFNNGNIFTAQLSDASGSFASPVDIGSLSSATSGIINATIPSGTTSGSGYRIRVVCNNPVVTGSDNGADIIIQPFTRSIIETMGSAPASVSIASHEAANGFDNDNYTMTGLNATVENNVASSGYAGASGLANVNIDPITSSFFQIAGVNTLNSSIIQLSFGVQKNKNTETGSNLAVEISSDGINYSALTFPPLPTVGGAATAWNLRTASGIIPQAANLRIRFRQLSTNSRFRIDDIVLTLTPTDISPGITASGTLAFCPGGVVTLTTINGNGYLWSNGSTSQSITTGIADNYSVIVAGANNCSATFSAVTVTSPDASFTPSKQWDVRFGGNAEDHLNSLQTTSDGGYILGGNSNSGISGDKTQASQGDDDYWIVKVNSNGVKQWDARFGGSLKDDLTSVQQTNDGGYILGGYSLSGISGDKTQASQGDYDYWVVKVNSSGVKQWDARFGGNDLDVLISLQQTSDGGYILGGYSGSGFSGDKTQFSHGGEDYWIVKINSNGVKEWDASFGGSGNDEFHSLQQTSDGGFILGGYSGSGISGDKTQASQGGGDYWIVKVNSIGVKQWDARFGGSGEDVLQSLQQTSDGGYIIGGSSTSGISGDKTQAFQGGNSDYWIVKVNSSGEKQWDAGFGGSGVDFLPSLQQTNDGGYILGGFSDSGISGDKTQASQGGRDYWILKITNNGVKKWDVRFGGIGDDNLYSVEQTSDGGYILGGFSNSPISGDKTQGSWTGTDYWIVKLKNIPVIAPGGPTTFCNGNSVTLTATSGNNYLWSNGETTQSIMASATGNYSVTVDGCYTSDAVNVTVQNCPVTLQLKLFIEGYYLGGGLMINTLYQQFGVPHSSLDVDTISISAMTAGGSHNLVDAEKGILKTNGDVTVTFGNTVFVNTPYFIKINQLNSLETWSAAPILMAPSTFYSFSSAKSQAFDNNESLTFDALYAAIYSGDINRDGTIDASDFLELDPIIQNGDGGYLIYDLNGDGTVDASDYLVLDPNIQNGIGAATP